MLPAIRDGECLVVAPATARTITRGDVVLCATWRGLVAHRVVAIGGGGAGALTFTLRGDASGENDRAVGGAQVLGRIVGVERAGRLRGVALRGGPLGAGLLAAGRRLRPALAAARAWLAPAHAPNAAR
jgi:hypothetical protein